MKRTMTLNGGGGCQTREGTINNGDVIVPIVPMILKKAPRRRRGCVTVSKKRKSLAG